MTDTCCSFTRKCHFCHLLPFAKIGQSCLLNSIALPGRLKADHRSLGCTWPTPLKPVDAASCFHTRRSSSLSSYSPSCHLEECWHAMESRKKSKNMGSSTNFVEFSTEMYTQHTQTYTCEVCYCVYKNLVSEILVPKHYQLRVSILSVCDIDFRNLYFIIKSNERLYVALHGKTWTKSLEIWFFKDFFFYKVQKHLGPNHF